MNDRLRLSDLSETYFASLLRRLKLTPWKWRFGELHELCDYLGMPLSGVTGPPPTRPRSKSRFQGALSPAWSPLDGRRGGEFYI